MGFCWSDSTCSYSCCCCQKIEEGYSKKTHIPKGTLEVVLSLPVERKIPKVTELETIHATAEQQEEMERLLLKKNKKE